ncbi:MAG: DnaJ domain-containing protein [Firmicutes bacterium]|nr:DnaJ domain-containing protein [Bacillota bacterium]
MDYYQILGIKRFSSDIEVKTAYRSLVKIWHPDINAEGAVKFKQITEANAILSDPKKRKEYDASLVTPAKQATQAPQGYSAQKAKFDIAVADFLETLPSKDRKTARSLFSTAERLSEIKAQAKFNKVAAQITADAEQKISELRRRLDQQSKSKK